MDHLINEVDEDLRRERMQRLWSSFGRYIVLFSVLIVVATAIIVGWKNYQMSKKEEWSAALLEADNDINLKKYAEAKAALTPVFEDGSKELSIFAGLRLSEIAIAEHNMSEAKDLLNSDALVNIKGKNKLYAKLRDLLYLASSDDIDKNNVKLDGEAFSLLEKEVIAGKYIAKGDKNKAKEILLSLSENALTPSDMKQRVKLILTYLEKDK